MTQSNEAKTSHPSPLQNPNKAIQSVVSEDFNKGCKGRGKYLGIDFGKAKVGLAVADSETKIAFVHSTIDNDKNLLPGLLEIIQAENIEKVIIGIPSYSNREDVEYESERFGKLLEKELGVEVEYQNEMFTTKMAQNNLIERGVKHVKSQDDQEAARIILQGWLDKILSTKP